MISHLFIVFLIAYFLGMNMGGSGIGPSFSAAFGVDIIRKSVIFGLFGIMVLFVALIAGNQTAYTLGRDLINPKLLNSMSCSIILFSIAISLFIANLTGIPQSTSQSTVFAIIAPALYFESANLKNLFSVIIPTWFILPVIAFVLCLLIGKFIYLPIRKTGITISKKFNNNKWLRFIIICCCCYVAFSIGANNVANASGPLLTMISNELGVNDENKLLLLLMMIVFIIAPSFGLGASIFGNKVIQNTGKEIVLFGKIEAAIIAFITASLLLCASLAKGIPTSLVQLNVAAILGIGVAKLGFKNIFKKIEVKNFFFMWVIAPFISFTLSLLLTILFDKMNWLG